MPGHRPLPRRGRRPARRAAAAWGSRRRYTSSPSSPPCSASGGLEIAHVGVQALVLGRRHVGRIAHHDPERARFHAFEQVGLEKVDQVSEAEGLAVPLGDLQRRRGGVGGQNTHVTLLGEAEGDSPAARAHVGDTRRCRRLGRSRRAGGGDSGGSGRSRNQASTASTTSSVSGRGISTSGVTSRAM